MRVHTGSTLCKCEPNLPTNSTTQHVSAFSSNAWRASLDVPTDAFTLAPRSNDMCGGVEKVRCFVWLNGHARAAGGAAASPACSVCRRQRICTDGKILQAPVSRAGRAVRNAHHYHAHDSRQRI